MISEADWKAFKEIKEKALERICGEALMVAQEELFKAGSTNLERCQNVLQLLVKCDKRIGVLFEDHSRTKARMQLVMLRQEGLVLDEDMATMSEEFRNATNPVRLFG